MWLHNITPFLSELVFGYDGRRTAYLRTCFTVMVKDSCSIFFWIYFDCFAIWFASIVVVLHTILSWLDLDWHIYHRIFFLSIGLYFLCIVLIATLMAWIMVLSNFTFHLRHFLRLSLQTFITWVCIVLPSYEDYDTPIVLLLCAIISLSK